MQNPQIELLNMYLGYFKHTIEYICVLVFWYDNVTSEMQIFHRFPNSVYSQI